MKRWLTRAGRRHARRQSRAAQSAPPRGDGLSLQLTVESVAYGAKGVARHQGKVYFIADTVAGDLVEAEVIQDNGRYGEAQMRRLLVPSPLRGIAVCPQAAVCGGCQWLGISYDQQLEWKRSFVTAALTRIGKLDHDVPVTMIPAPATTGYRNRILLRLHLHPGGVLKFGYFRRQSRELVPISACAIAAPAINDLLSAMDAVAWNDLPALTVRLEIQEVAAVGPGKLLVTVYPGDGERSAIATFTERVRSLPNVHWADMVFALQHAPMVPFEDDLDRQFLTMPGQFQQVNLELNRTLRRLIKDYVDERQPQRLLDVFCGSGNLSLPLADGDRYIEGIEANREAIRVARRNADANQLTNVRYLAGDAERHLWKVDRAGEAFDFVLLDPPRQGIYAGMVPLKNIAPKSIVYVSCDPSTLARDLGYLCRNDTYKLARVIALDFFPNTYHVETVAFLERA